MRMSPASSSSSTPAPRGGLGLGLAFVAVLGLGLASHAADGKGKGKERDPQVGESFRVPYRLTDTNHFLVRVRINGKGPFNFLVDSGAPALFVATETAAQIGLKPQKGKFWTPVERLDFEGGATLRDIKARVEDPFQLVGMNALGLPGASIHGILGFTILARFRLEIDPSKDRMTWTRLDHDPADPPVPPQDDRNGPPAELQAMNAIGPLAKGLAFLMGKQPEVERIPRGFLGLEWSGPEAAGRVRIDRPVEGSPAAKAGLLAGDEIVQINGKAIDGLKAALEATAAIRPGDAVNLAVRRDGADHTANFRAGEGF